MVDQQSIFSSLNEGMLHERSRAFVSNLEKNIPLIKKFGGLQRVVNRFSGKHIIIVGAGPSLDGCFRELDALSRIEDVVLLATDMALAPLINHGIAPHYVITCETTPAGFFNGIDTSKMHLLSFSCASNSNIRGWRGGISFFNWMIKGGIYDNLWMRAGDLGFVATGSIVTTQAISIVLGCGVASVLIVGNDMGFFDRFYTSGVYSTQKIYSGSCRFNPDTTIDMNRGRLAREYKVARGGEIFYTNNQFLAAKMWLENLFGSAPYPVADCSIPGCAAGVVHKIGISVYLSIFNKSKQGGSDDQSS